MADEIESPDSNSGPRNFIEQSRAVEPFHLHHRGNR